MVEIGLPDGNCFAIGGYNVTSACTDLGNYTVVWPGAWQTTTSGTYTASVDLSGAGLTGTGPWSFTLVNGWTTSAGVDYDATLTLNGLCTSDDIEIPGCTDAGAFFKLLRSEDEARYESVFFTSITLSLCCQAAWSLTE